MEIDGKTGKSLKDKVLCRVFSEDYERTRNKILDPRGQFIDHWSKIFLAACLVSLIIDPLFFYLPIANDDMCLNIGFSLETTLTITRSVVDVFYVIQIFVRFHTAYVAPSSRVFGRGELVIDSSKIALRYLQKAFWIDVIAALPLPQVLIWLIIPNLRGSIVTDTRTVLPFVILFQYLPRVYLIFPLASQLVEATGVVTETAWAGAAYNLLLYLLASHVSGAIYYLLSVQREIDCWKSVCKAENCQNGYFDCHSVQDPGRVAWLNSSNITNICNPSNSFYEWGIHINSLQAGATSSSFSNKFFYGLWWGIQQLSSVGQNLSTSNHIGENIFAIIVSTEGLVFLALLIGNMQRYLQATTMRIEEQRVKRNDTEQWMHHRQLPPELRNSIRKYDQYKWLATKGVDEEAILQGLPMDLRKEIKHHLCFGLVRKVPLFDQMDETMLDAICERLKPVLCTKDLFLVREGDPVKQMLFIIRGHLDSYTTDGGRTGFFNSCRIGPGDFCGEELLTWALDPRPSVTLPSSTRTVKANTEVEAFALIADDLKFVASQFRRLHSKQLKHKFRSYSHQWRTWAACFIQAAWRRHKKLKETAHLRGHEPGVPQQGSFWSRYAESLLASTRLSIKRRQSGTDSDSVSSLEKPAEPNFSER
ncbi:protein CNGC15c-like [Hevea brasiliensis]|nr:protein CNGC15c-like [Hevea brasiliensis]